MSNTWPLRGCFPLATSFLICIPLLTFGIVGNAQERSPRRAVEEFNVVSEKFFEKLFGDSEIARRQLDRVPVSRQEEDELGEQVFRAFLNSLQRQEIRLLKRGKDVNYLKALVAEIRPRMQNARRYRSLQVYVADSDSTDARSFPGGTIVVFAGLLDYAPSEAAIVGVLGHELSHIDRGHLLDGVRRMKLARNTFSSGKLSPQEFMTAGKIMISQFARPFRPEQETEADLDAARWVLQSGYDPMEMAKLFLQWHARDGGGQLPLPSFFRTHPYHRDRYEAVRELSVQLNDAKPERALYVGKQNLLDRVPRSKKRYPE